MRPSKPNRIIRFIIRNTLFVLILIGCVTAYNFPYDTGSPSGDDTLDESANYYQDIYTPREDGTDQPYVLFGQESSHSLGLADDVASFTERYGLGQARTLEIGAGSGTLQDLATDYTGLDIAASAARFFHKPFVEGSATDLPFDDDSFDVVWTIWTLEHVPNPELALREIRRVLKDGGYLYLRPAWNVPTWASEPFVGVPFRQRRLWDQVKTIGILAQNQPAYRAIYRTTIRLLRLAASLVVAPTQLRHNTMTPNYSTYAVADADAVNSIDCFETRGDLILEQGSTLSELKTVCGRPVLVQIRKESTTFTNRINNLARSIHPTPCYISPSRGQFSQFKGSQWSRTVFVATL